ncbi:MAG TPA: hypothetical protein VFQ35_19950 [Polyangiaceae bacterium]|nr:hypothetical protein [Polyangiaceae bacterium]
MSQSSAYFATVSGALPASDGSVVPVACSAIRRAIFRRAAGLLSVSKLNHRRTLSPSTVTVSWHHHDLPRNSR